MSRLAPDLFDRRFDQLLELGRSRLPALAPDWTDYNAHDPGITLMELLAWVAEAQIYALARVRRDERAAYAALLGVLPSGTSPARGLIWPDRADPQSPAATFGSSVVIGTDVVVTALDNGTTFRPSHKVLWVPGRIRRLHATLANGRTRDFTAINERGGPPFLPFGETAGRRDALMLEYECAGDQGLFPPDRADAAGAALVIGIRADAALSAAVDTVQQDARFFAWSITLESPTGRFALPVLADSTAGMMRTGAIVLDVSSIPDSPRRFALELRAVNGFARPARIVRIDLNVLPVEQRRAVSRESHLADGRPDLSFELAVPGVQFAAGEEPVQLDVKHGSTEQRWKRCARLVDQDPDAQVFEFDLTRNRVTFGNGVNGAIPPADANVFVTYAVCDGVSGNVARNRQWRVALFEPSFGVNLDAVTGGVDASDTVSQRREARRRARDDHAIVTADDVIAAALALPLLEVARAWVAAPRNDAPYTGETTLVAMRARPGGIEPDDIPETPRWLESIRRQLVGRMTLGTRLRVVAPQYVSFRMAATVIADAGRDPKPLEQAVGDALAARLALIAPAGDAQRAPGVPVTRRDLMAWMRAVDGVSAVADVQLTLGDDRRVQRVDVPPNGLPRFDRAQSRIVAQRPAQASRR